MARYSPVGLGTDDHDAHGGLWSYCQFNECIDSLSKWTVLSEGRTPPSFGPVKQAETRRAIVSAAARLFVAQGFGRTTIEAIAAEAGVGRNTVFSVGGKLDLLKLALDWAVVGTRSRSHWRSARRSTPDGQASDPI